MEWYLQFPFPAILVSSLGFVLTYILFFLFSPGMRFRLQPVQGLVLNLLLVSLGLMITWQKDPRNNSNWYGNFYQQGDQLIVKISEPPVKKQKSDKAEAAIEAVVHNGLMIDCKGKILLYFARSSAGGANDTSANVVVQYGDRLLINKTLQRIKNSGNPGAFNYERYAAFQQLFHNTFLKEKDWVRLTGKSINPLNQFVFAARDHVLSALRKNIKSGSDELGLSEALLIGYTNDLERDLVQAYSNTGVVHIIAISGMHLALIYLLLAALFKKIPVLNKSRLIQVILILGCLWLFSLLTGASASVIRAAVMFTFITIGTNIKRKSSIYNSLAASAFVILCYNPYFLWDVGFQLSYLAVISIIIFQRHVHGIFRIKNKWAEKIWELAAVSLAAQILTFPVCIYYFHQFPNFFLLTNIIAVPLSSIILYAEIGLVAVSRIPFIGNITGKIVTWLVWLMNKSIFVINRFPYAVWENIPATLLSTWLLYAAVAGLGGWYINKNGMMLRFGLACLCAVMMVYAYENWQAKMQQKIIVYNVSQHCAIDFISGNQYYFAGDTILQQDAALQNFSLRPARIALHLNQPMHSLKALFEQASFYRFDHTTVLLVDHQRLFEVPDRKINIDLIIISKNPAIHISELAAVFNCPQYIFDASNSLWKIDKWQKECEELHLRSYSVPDKGAFVVDVR